MSEPISTDTLKEGALFYGVELDSTALARFSAYAELLEAWNRRMNLVSRRDMERLVAYHFLDSLKAASRIDFSRISSLMDFGSGAGLPGVPLAIAFPHIRVTLVESRLKRARFLAEVAEKINGLEVSVIRSRVENLPHTLDSSFDMVITRATVKLADFFRLTRRFLSERGALLAIKGDSVENEISDLGDVIDKRLFHISSTTPDSFDGVRRGTIVVISRR